MRRSPQISASPSGFRAAALSTISQMLFGRSLNASTTRSPKRASWRIGGIGYADQSIGRSPSALLHGIDMFGRRKGARAHVVRIGLDRFIDRRTEIAVTAHEFRRLRRQPQHVLEHENLPVAGRARADPDGGDG